MRSPVLNIILRGGLDPEVAAWRSAIAANGGSVGPAAVREVNTFVRGCKADGVWDALLDVGLFAGVDNLAAALVKLKSPIEATRILTNFNFVAGDYNAAGPTAGLLGNATNKYITFGLSPAVLGMTDASLLYYCTVSAQASDLRFTSPLAAYDSPTQRAAVFSKFSTATNIGCTFGSNDLTFIGSPLGSVVATNDGTNSYIYKNGASAGDPLAQTFIATTQVMHGFRYTPSGYTGGRYTALVVARYLTATRVAALSARVNTLMTAFGANVY